MSDPSRFDRRSLFDALRRALGSDEPKAKSPTAFSLESFYAGRTVDSGSRFPRVTLREGVASIETTPVGAGVSQDGAPPQTRPRSAGSQRGRES